MIWTGRGLQPRRSGNMSFGKKTIAGLSLQCCVLYKAAVTLHEQSADCFCQQRVIVTSSAMSHCTNTNSSEYLSLNPVRVHLSRWSADLFLFFFFFFFFNANSGFSNSRQSSGSTRTDKLLRAARWRCRTRGEGGRVETQYRNVESTERLMGRVRGLGGSRVLESCEVPARPLVAREPSSDRSCR